MWDVLSHLATPHAGIVRFELVRGRLGRRSRGRLRGWPWSERSIDDLLGELVVLGPGPDPVDE